MSLIPATIVTGFLGSGKTTLLKQVLTQAHGQKIAVIENEFGSENIDAEILVSDVKEQIIQMNNGCICCTIREDLRQTLQLLVSKKRQKLLDFDRLIIETTGMADPGPVAQTFFMDDEVAENFLLDSILTLVDAKHANQQLDQRQQVRKQIGFADQIFISKADLVSSAELAALQQRLTQMNPRVAQKVLHFGQVDLSAVFDLRGFNLNTQLDIDPDFLSLQSSAADHYHDHSDDGACQHPSHQRHHGHDDDVKSFAFHFERAFDAAKLEDFLAAAINIYGPRMLRYKGVLYVKGVANKVVFQGVHQLMGSDLGPAWGANEKRFSKMVFIGIDLPQDIFLQGMEQSLV